MTKRLLERRAERLDRLAAAIGDLAAEATATGMGLATYELEQAATYMRRAAERYIDRAAGKP